MKRPATRIWLCVAALSLAQVPATLAENIDPLGDGSQYAYGENVGWLNAEPMPHVGNGTPGVHVTSSGLTGWMWGENIGWISLSCENTSSCKSVDYGVSHSGDGVLSGFAWGENVGWISFSCESTSSCDSTDYRVTIDPLTGVFTGKAWGENAGWITFASASPVPYRVQTYWCAPAPETLVLELDKPTGCPQVAPPCDVALLWTSPIVDRAFDVVQGNLNVLRGMGGDYASATTGCLEDDTSNSSLTQSENPAAGNGFWFLVRADCGGGYDSGGTGQAEPRDSGIASSGNDCSLGPD